jgi:8-oxo-dGTP diphosphatase
MKCPHCKEDKMFFIGSIYSTKTVHHCMTCGLLLLMEGENFDVRLARRGILNKYKNPTPTVDILLHDKNSNVLMIYRKNEPHGWALPGGFVNEGESYEDAAERELWEETDISIVIAPKDQYRLYSNPKRDPRAHITSMVYSLFVPDLETRAMRAKDDACKLKLFPAQQILAGHVDTAFDHANIISDFFSMT